MNTNPSNWDELAARARQGESEAATALKEALAPQMGRLVRRALNGGAPRSALDRQIQAEAERARQHHPEPAGDPDTLARLVTQRLCARLMQAQINPYLATGQRPETAVA